MSTSMVKGNPLKLMLHFALPLLIGNLLQQTYNIIDAAIVGQILGAKALASVGASSSVQFLVLGFCMGSCTGFGVPVAKYFGGNNLEKMRDYIFERSSSGGYYCRSGDDNLRGFLPTDPASFICAGGYL